MSYKYPYHSEAVTGQAPSYSNRTMCERLSNKIISFIKTQKIIFKSFQTWKRKKQQTYIFDMVVLRIITVYDLSFTRIL